MEKAMEAFGDPVEVGRELKLVHGGATRRDALLTALPPVLLGLSMAVPLLFRVPLSQLVIGSPTRASTIALASSREGCWSASARWVWLR